MSVTCYGYGVSWSDAKDWLWNNHGITYGQAYAQDNLHPSELGYKIIASKMLRLICGDPKSNDVAMLEPYEGTTFNATIISQREGNILHFNARISNFSAQNGVYTQMFALNSDLIHFTPLRECIMPVYKLNSDSDSAYVTGLLGYTCSNSEGTQIRMVNTSGADYSGAVCVKGDIVIGGISKTYTH